MARQSKLNFADPDFELEVGVLDKRGRAKHKKHPKLSSGKTLTVAQVGVLYEYGSEDQPPRPAFRDATHKYQKQWRAQSARIARAVMNAKTPAAPHARRLLTEAGATLAAMMKAEVVGKDPANEPKYAARKRKHLGHSVTGLVTRQLVDAIGYKVGKSPARYKV